MVLYSYNTTYVNYLKVTNTMDKIFASKLKYGDEIRVISPSSSIERVGGFEDNIISKIRLEDLGFKVTFGRHILENDRLYSSSINSRLSDIHEAFSDENVKAILTTIGGLNCNELLPYIDWNLIKQNPKMFIAGTKFLPEVESPILFLELSEGGIPLEFSRYLAQILEIHTDVSGLVIGRFPTDTEISEEILYYILDKFPILKTIPVIYDVDFGIPNQYSPSLWEE